MDPVRSSSVAGPCRPLPVAAALLLAACASVPPPAAPAAATPAAARWRGGYDAGVGDVDLQLGGTAPLEGSGPLLSSGFSFAGLAQRVGYRAGYEVEPGDVLDPAAASTWRAGALPQSLGRQTLEQQLRLRLDPLYGAPVTVGAQYRQQEALLLEGQRATAQQSVDLAWAPAFAAFRLNWTPEGAPADSGQALQCEVSGQLQLPIAAPGGAGRDARRLAVDARTRACRVLAAEATPAAASLGARTWSTGLRWGGTAQETALRLQSVTPQAGAALLAERPPIAGSGYELRLSEQRALGDWQASGGLAYRRAPEAVGDAPGENSPWAANARLTRRLSNVAVAASWTRGDPYWFLPDLRQAADNFALSLDFSPWANSLWHGYAPTMAVSYSWLRADAGNTVGNGRDADQSINWNLAFPWR